MSRSKVEALFKEPGSFTPLPGATSPQDYEDAIVGAARQAHAQAPPDVQAKHPLDIPYLKQQSHRLFRHLHGATVSMPDTPGGSGK